MSKTNLPGFTADVSLYKARGYYQTGRRAINSSTQLISAIYPARIMQGGIDCGNCVGGECAQLNCFEEWTHGEGGSGGGGGGGGGGPYVGGGGGGGGGSFPWMTGDNKACCAGERCINLACPGRCEYKCQFGEDWGIADCFCGGRKVRSSKKFLDNSSEVQVNSSPHYQDVAVF